MKFKLKNILVLVFVGLFVVGCTSSKVGEHIPLDSSALIDENIVYKSETVKVEIEEMPIHSLGQKIEYIGKEVAELDESESDEVISVEKKEVAELDESESDEVISVEKKDVAELDEIESDEVISVEKKDVENLFAQSVSEVEDIKIITPVVAKSDATVDFIDGVYVNTDELEFEMAVRQAQEKYGVKSKQVNVKSKPQNRRGDVYPMSHISKNLPVPVPVSAHRKFVIKEVEPERAITFLSTIVYHSNAKADVSNKDIKALKSVADFIKKNNGTITVVGNSSSRSKDMTEIQNKIQNFNLSLLRAEKVRKVLIKQGVPEKNISISAVSDTEKIIQENMPINEAMNRRTEIYINY